MKIWILALAQHEPLREQHLHQAFQVTAVILRQVDPERIEIVEFVFGQPPRRRYSAGCWRIAVESRRACLDGFAANLLGQRRHGRNAEFLFVLHQGRTSGAEQECDILGVHGLRNRLAGALDPFVPVQFRWLGIAVPQKLEFSLFFDFAHIPPVLPVSYLAALFARAAISAHRAMSASNGSSSSKSSPSSTMRA